VAVALVAVLAYDPMAVLDAGFWLSFLAVGAIVFVQGSRMGPQPRFVEGLSLQWVVGIALLPATVAIFGTFPAAGLLVNLAAIPVFSVLLVPPILVATACLALPLPPAQWCGVQLVQLAGAVAALLWPALCWCADLPGALWRASPPRSWYLLAVPAVLAALLPLGLRMRMAALALLASVFLLRAPRPPEGALWIDVRASSSATALLLRTRSHLLLVGTGEVYGSTGDAFARRLLPLLREARYPAIDLWLPGSLTRDVQVALRIAAAEFTVREALLPPSASTPPEMQHCAERQWRWDGIDMHLLAGADGRSCVLSVARGRHHIELRDLGREAIDAGGSLDFVLDDAGLALRPMRLRL
jgi:competence protein ComEC